MEQITTKGLT